MTVDETPPPTSAVSESGDGRADQGGFVNTGIIKYVNVYNSPAPDTQAGHPKGVSRRTWIKTAAGLGLFATGAAWMNKPQTGHRNTPASESGSETQKSLPRPASTVTPTATHSYNSAGRLLSPAIPAGNTVWSVALGMLRSEPLAVVGRENGNVQLWNPVTGTARSRPLPGHTQPVYSLALRDTMAVSASTDGTLRIWDLTSDPPWSTPTSTPIPGGINGVALCTVDGRTVAVSACADRTVRIWDPANPGRSGRVLGQTLDAAVNSIAVGTIGEQTIAVTGSGDGSVMLWDVTGERLVRVLGAHDKKEVWAMAVGSVGGRPVAVSGSEDGAIRRWDLEARQSPGKELGRFPKAIKTVAIGELAGRTVAVTGCDDSSIRIWDLDTGAAYGRGLTGPSKVAEAIAISNVTARPTVVSGHYDGSLWIWAL